MRISVLIPTFRRPDYLDKALRGLREQNRPPDEVILGVRQSDAETRAYLAANPETSLRLKIADVEKPGVLASMTAAASRAKGDLLCLLDDDAEPLPDWLALIEERFRMHPHLGILGGRDLLQDDPEMRRREPVTKIVGLFTWYGRLLGNHHRGTGGYREVHAVKGCNCAIRARILQKTGFAKGLRGQGAQVHWELALCLDVANLGYTIAYDPAIRVTHHIGPRHDADLSHRGKFAEEGIFNMVFNEHLVIRSRGGAWTRFSHQAWSLLVGSTTAPGLLQFLRLTLTGDPHRVPKLRATFRGMRAARKGTLLK